MLFVEKLFLWFLFYSFCGWVYESILVSILERRPVNRGFLNGPLCPIYGVGAVGAVVVLGQVHNPLVVFLLSDGRCQHTGIRHILGHGGAVSCPLVGLLRLQIQS